VAVPDRCQRRGGMSQPESNRPSSATAASTRSSTAPGLARALRWPICRFDSLSSGAGRQSAGGGAVHLPCAAASPGTGGRIANIASLGGKVGVPGNTSYSASKFGVVGFSDALRMGADPHGRQRDGGLPILGGDGVSRTVRGCPGSPGRTARTSHIHRQDDDGGPVRAVTLDAAWRRRRRW